MSDNDHENNFIMDPKEALQKSYLAGNLSPSELEQLLGLGTVKQLNKGDIPINEADTTNDLMILVKGTLQVISLYGDEITDIKPGSVFGEMAMVDDGPRSATILCKEDCEAVIIPAKRLELFLIENPQIAAKIYRNIARVLCQRLRSSNRMLSAMFAIGW